MRIALVGCGSIGKYIIESSRSGREDYSVHAVVGRPGFDLQPKRLAAQLGCDWGTDVLSMDLSAIDLVIEAAGPTVVREILIPLLRRGKDVMVMSVGPLSDSAFLQEVHEAARSMGRRVYLPSGAIGGLDALRSAAQERLDSVVLTTRKPPHALKQAPYVIQHQIDLDGLTQETEIFEGNALEAIEAFPANVNVAVLISLAGIGPERTQVRINACPGLETNIHEIRVTGAFGRMLLQFENVPSPHNPKTSYLTGLSAVNTLRRIGSPVL